LPATFIVGRGELALSRRNVRARVRRSVPILVAAAALAGLLTIAATGTASGTRNAYPGNFVAKPSALTPGATFTGAKSLSGLALERHAGW
jgi:hypothetical protein